MLNLLLLMGCSQIPGDMQGHWKTGGSQPGSGQTSYKSMNLGRRGFTVTGYPPIEGACKVDAEGREGDGYKFKVHGCSGDLAGDPKTVKARLDYAVTKMFKKLPK